MKKVVVLVGAAFVMYDIEGMLQLQSFSQRSGFPERNLDVFPGYSLWQEQWEEQRRRESSLSEIKQKILSETADVKFDKTGLLDSINSTIKGVFIDLLEQVLNGNIDSLKFLSERVYSGRLMNKLIFTSEVDLSQRQEIIFKISLELLRGTANVSDCLENIRKFYPKKIESLGISF